MVVLRPEMRYGEQCLRKIHRDEGKQSCKECQCPTVAGKVFPKFGCPRMNLRRKRFCLTDGHAEADESADVEL